MVKSLIAVILSGSLIVMTAAPPSIGTVTSTGDIRLDGSTIHGNTTVFDGSLIETTSARSMLALSGVRITLAPDSRAKLFRGRTVLEQGTGVVWDAEQHVIEAATLRISTASKGSLLQVEISGPNTVAVAARNGSAEVRNRAGVLVARLNAGMALAFDPQAGAAVEARMTGVLESKSGKFFLTDGIAGVTAELQGTDLTKYAGKRVEITGSTIPDATAAGTASQVVQVTGIRMAGGKAAAAGAAGGAAGAAGAAAGAAGGAAAGIGAGATVAIIGGVAAASTVLGLAAVGAFSGAPSASAQ